MTLELIEEFWDKLDISSVSQSKVLTESFIRNNIHRLDPDNLAINRNLTMSLIREFEHIFIRQDTEWSYISSNKNLDAEFIRKYADKLDWYHLSKHIKEDVLREHINIINWMTISSNRNLTMPLIREFKDKLVFSALAYNRNLDESFIYENMDLFKPFMSILMQRQSLEFITKRHEQGAPYLLNPNLTTDLLGDLFNNLNLELKVIFHPNITLELLEKNIDVIQYYFNGEFHRHT
jgi:hypothetical protein